MTLLWWTRFVILEDERDCVVVDEHDKDSVLSTDERGVERKRQRLEDG